MIDPGGCPRKVWGGRRPKPPRDGQAAGGQASGSVDFGVREPHGLAQRPGVGEFGSGFGFPVWVLPGSGASGPLARGDGGLASCQHQWGATMETARLEPRPPSFMAVRRIVVSKIGTQDNADCREIERPPSIVSGERSTRPCPLQGHCCWPLSSECGSCSAHAPVRRSVVSWDRCAGSRLSERASRRYCG